jgi:CRP/FNR family nitrogen fixation transcriptional regulator
MVYRLTEISGLGAGFRLTRRELQCAQEGVLLLVKRAQERVAGFLLEMAGRASVDKSVELPMSREDIAHYLGLTIETVSRTLSALQYASLIELPTSRQIALHNPPGVASDFGG